MPLRSTALGALLFLSGCATKASHKPAAHPRDEHTARAPVAPQPTAEPPGDEAADEAPAHEGPAVTPRQPAPAAAEPPPATAPAAAAAQSAPRADPFGDVGFKEVNEKDWLAGIRRTIAQREGIAPAEVRFSPGFLRAVFVRSSPVAATARPGRPAPPRRHEIVVVDNQGRQVASFRPITAHGSDEPPGDVRFLSEERLLYEVVARVPAAAPPAAKRPPTPRTRSHTAAHAGKARPLAVPPHAPPGIPAGPPRLFVIQPVAPRARPIRCEGFHFTFTREHDRFAFMGGGSAGTNFVAVDGAQVYPRRGRTVVASAPVWSKDGRSLAFLEAPPSRPPRLVLVAELDNPAGDTTWDLPADANIEGAAVVWTGAGKLVVRKPAARPIFSTTFVTER